MTASPGTPAPGLVQALSVLADANRAHVEAKRRLDEASAAADEARVSALAEALRAGTTKQTALAKTIGVRGGDIWFRNLLARARDVLDSGEGQS